MENKSNNNGLKLHKLAEQPIAKFVLFSPAGMAIMDSPGMVEHFAQLADAASRTNLGAGPAIRAMGKGVHEWAKKSVCGEMVQIGPLKYTFVRIANIEQPIKALLPHQAAEESLVDEARPGRGLIVEP